MSINGILGTGCMIHHKAVIDFSDGAITLIGRKEDNQLSVSYHHKGGTSCQTE